MSETKLSESELLRPVLTLFSENRYWRFGQIPLGRKKIDLVCVERDAPMQEPLLNSRFPIGGEHSGKLP